MHRITDHASHGGQNKIAFPVEDLPPIFRDAVIEATRNEGIPFEINVAAAMSAAAVAIQSRANISYWTVRPRPLSLFFVTLGESGERKSSAFSLFHRAIEQYQNTQQAALAAAIRTYEDELKAHKRKKGLLRKAIAAAEANGEPAEDFKQDLDNLSAPRQPAPAQFIFSNMTPQAVLKKMKEQPCLGIFSEDASTVFNGRTMDDTAMFNLAWDGKALDSSRVVSGDLYIPNPRLSISFLAQLEVVQEYLQNKGHLVRSNGFLSRVFLAVADRLVGSRYIDGIKRTTPAIDAFNARLTEILETPQQFGADGELIRLTLHLSPAAESFWIKYYNQIEAAMQVGGRYEKIADAASRSAEQVARMAGIFHYMEGCVGEITEDCIRRAASICRWYLEQFKEFFEPKPEADQLMQDVALLQGYFEKHGRQAYYCWSKNSLRQRCPNPLREPRTRFDSAMEHLEKRHLLTIQYERRGAGMKPTAYVYVKNPYGFNPEKNHRMELDASILSAIPHGLFQQPQSEFFVNTRP